MNVIRGIALRLASLVPLALCACSTPTELGLVHDAIDRRGGEETIRAAGTIVRGGTGEILGTPITFRSEYRPPNRLRWTVSLPSVDPAVDLMFDGHAGYALHGELSTRLEPSEVQVIRNRAMDETVFWLVGLDDPNLVVSDEGEREFGGRPVRSLRVEHWSGYSRILHFDRETDDLVGSEGNTWTELGRRYVETTYAEFADYEGVRVPTRIEQKIDGAPFLTMIHDSVRFEPPRSVEATEPDDAPSP